MLRSCCFVTLLVFFAATACGQESGTEPSLARKELQEKRSALFKQFETALESKEPKKAISVAEQIAELERALIRAAMSDASDKTTQSEVLRSLNDRLQWLSARYQEAERFDEAIRAEEERLDGVIRLYGENNYRVTDARLSLSAAKLLAGLSPDDRKVLTEADELDQRMNSLYQGGEYPAAARMARQVLEMRGRLLDNEHPDYATSVHNLAHLYQLTGDYAAAVPLYHESKAIWEKLLGKEHPTYAATCINLASYYQLMGDYTLAEPLYLEAKVTLEKVLGKQHPTYAIILNNLATLYEAMGDYAAAEPLLRRTKEIVEKVLGKGHPQYAGCLSNLGGLYESMGNYAAAKPLYLESKAIREKVLGKEHPDYAYSVNDLAVLYESMGDYTAAEPLYLEAKLIRERVLGKEHPKYATCLNNLAGLYRTMGNYTAAEPLLLEAKAISKKVLGKEHPKYATSLNNLGFLYASMTDYAAAEPLLLEAKAIRKKVLGKEHPDYAYSLNNLASLYSSMGNYAAAEPLYLEANAIWKKVLGKEHPKYADTLINFANHYRSMDEFAEAGPFYSEAISITLAHLDKTSVVQSEQQQIRMNQSVRYRLDDYLQCCLEGQLDAEQAIAQLVTWKGSVLVRSRSLRLAAEDPAIADQFRKLQSIASQISATTRNIPQPQQLKKWRERLDALTEDKRTLEAELMRLSSAYREAKKQVLFEEIRQAIPGDAILVDYLEYRGKRGRSILASVIRREGAPVLVGLGSSEAAGEAIDVWRESFGASAAAKAAGQRLREQIWQPLLKHIGSAKTVLVCTDGVLGRLPIGGLPGKSPDTYLIEDHRLALIPVPQLLPALVSDQDSKDLSRELLLLGDVDYDSQPREQPNDSKKKRRRRNVSADGNFSPLDGTAGEIATIADVYRDTFELDGDDVAKLEKSDASESQFRRLAPQFYNLHLATHGYFAGADKKSAMSVDSIRNAGERATMNDEDGVVRGINPYLLSGLALAGANREPKPNEDDGILTAQEIAFLPLEGVETVVLSACETGLGEVAGGEGLIGIQRAFQVAGARTTVASLWKVDDLVTRRLMERFYKNLWEKEMSRLDALREAQLYILRNPGSIRGVSRSDDATGPKRTPPEYWSAFQLSGDWR